MLAKQALAATVRGSTANGASVATTWVSWISGPGALIVTATTFSGDGRVLTSFAALSDDGLSPVGYDLGIGDITADGQYSFTAPAGRLVISTRADADGDLVDSLVVVVVATG